MKKFFYTLGFCIVGLVVNTQAQFTNDGWFRAQGQDTAPLSRDNFVTNSILPHLAGSAEPVTPIAEAITPELQALADGLKHDPLRIFHYVHDHIRYVLYFGSKK